MEKKPRGGKRPGAGRKPLLKYEDMIAIGGNIHERLRAAVQSKLLKSTAAGLVKSAAAKLLEHRASIDRLHKAINEVPLDQRHAYTAVRDEYGDDGFDDPDDSSPIGEMVGDIRGEFEAEQTLLGNAAPVVRSRMPQPGRRKILSQVAEEGGITVRMAEKCLEEYRRYLKSVNTETD